MEKFNFFKNIVFTETGHTSLLKKLLSKTGHHQQKDLFLKRFVIDVMGTEYKDKSLCVDTEIKAGQKGYVDLMIWNKNKDIIYIIENKINKAKDRPNQLYRYWKNHIMNRQIEFPTGDYKIFYLTRNGGKPSSTSLNKPKANNYINIKKPFLNKEEIIEINYKKHITSWIKNCIKEINPTTDNMHLIGVLEQYVEWIEKYMEK